MTLLFKVGRTNSLSAGKQHRQSRGGVAVPRDPQKRAVTWKSGASAPRKSSQINAGFSPGGLALPRSLLQQTLLQFLLAFDAVPRPWHRFQSLGVDLFPAVDALAKAAFANPRQRLLDHLQQLPLVVALAEQKFFGVGTGGAVGNILRRVFVGGAAVGLRARHRAAQILLPRLQPLLECF